MNGVMYMEDVPHVESQTATSPAELIERELLREKLFPEGAIEAMKQVHYEYEQANKPGFTPDSYPWEYHWSTYDLVEGVEKLLDFTVFLLLESPREFISTEELLEYHLSSNS